MITPANAIKMLAPNLNLSDEARMIRYSLPVIGRSYQNYDRLMENQRWVNDWYKNVGSRNKSAKILYPMRTGNDLAAYGGQSFRQFSSDLYRYSSRYTRSASDRKIINRNTYNYGVGGTTKNLYFL